MGKLISAVSCMAMMGAVSAAHAQSNVITLGSENSRAEGDDAQAAIAASGAGYFESAEPWRAAVDLALDRSKSASVAINGGIYGGVGIGLGRKTTANTGGGAYSVGGPSYILVSGRENLGGGKSVFFKLESGFNAKTGATESSTSFFNKQAYMGVQGPWGSLQAGRLYTPFFSTQALVADPSGSYALLSSSNIMETTGARLDNGFMYTLPGTTDVFAVKRSPGFAAAIAHYFSSNTGEGSASKGSSNGLKMGWLSDDTRFRIEGAIHKQNTYTAGSVDNNKTSWIVGAFYDFNFGRVHLAYAASKRKNNLADGATMEDFHEAMTGLNMPLGPGRLLVSAIRKVYRSSDPRGLKSRWQFGANYDYPLSRRTKLMFGAVTNVNSGPNAEYAANTSSYAGASASAGRQAAVTIGMYHVF
ncbi:MAG: porin [Ottowia sp.]|uniref:porin n=1 Tax=Ottowia sp. TaxID=1898956 RepID=UPI003C73A786